MDINKCFEILEIKKKSSLIEAKQSYKKLLSIYHPDKIAHNDDLKRQYQEKTTLIIKAYKEVKSFIIFKNNYVEQRESEPVPDNWVQVSDTNSISNRESDVTDIVPDNWVQTTEDKTISKSETDLTLIEPVPDSWAQKPNYSLTLPNEIKNKHMNASDKLIPEGWILIEQEKKLTKWENEIEEMKQRIHIRRNKINGISI